jgi:hypothetical protein
MRTKWTVTQWVSLTLGVVAVGLIPWTVLLGRTLPEETRVRNWATAWIGLDTVLIVGCTVTAVLARRRAERMRVTAAATGSVALLDGWFDMTTAATGTEFLAAVGCSIGELLLAVVCGVLALRNND